MSPLGARGSGFIVASGERGPLDQTDIGWTVILDPLGQWSIVREMSPDPTPGGGGRPGQLCNPDMWEENCTWPPSASASFPWLRESSRW